MNNPVTIYFAMSELDIDNNEVVEVINTDICGNKREVLKQLIDQLNEILDAPTIPV